MSAIERLVGDLSRLPGVGPKTALRFTYHLLRGTPERAIRLSEAIRELIERVRPCRDCGSYGERELCEICTDPRRDPTVLCVVEEAFEVEAIERAGSFRGRYHVLGGRLSPLDGIGPEELRIDGLLARIRSPESQVDEVIVATNTGVEGEATAIYLEERIRPLGPRVTRLARGVPMGSELEYVDGTTISEALQGRRVMGPAASIHSSGAPAS